MKMYYIIMFLLSLVTYSQITFIPGENFEDFLIQENIDTDGLINGQVSTSDIISLQSLDMSEYGLGPLNILDLTGIQDFEALENLDISYSGLTKGGPEGTSEQELDLTANTNLQTLRMIGDNDAFYLNLSRVDLSQNFQLNQILAGGNWQLKQLDLRTGSTDVSNLLINIDIIANDFSGQNDEELFCIKVTDPEAATAGIGVYSSWTISANNNPYYFSETCTLSTQSFTDKKISIYPNPVSNLLFFKARNAIKTITIYDNIGRKVLINSNISKNYLDVSNLNEGVYMLRIQTNSGISTKKLIKQ